jgi:hypothetical protein
MTTEFSAEPFAAKKYLEIKGRRMAYIDEGEGDAIVSSTEIRLPPIFGGTSCPN